MISHTVPPMDIATAIREGRRRAKLSQRALAAKLKVAPSAVAQWETGATDPKIEHRVDLAALLSIPFADMMPEVRPDQITATDPRTVALVQQFLGLPEPVQESILMQVAATAEAIAASRKGPHGKK